MQPYFEIAENFDHEDEMIPDMVDFYKNYAIQLLKINNIEFPKPFPNLNQLVDGLKNLAVCGNDQAIRVLKDIQRDNLAIVV